MTDRPILFSSPMVRAIVEGRKTQTRRVLNPQPQEDIGLALAENPIRFAVGDRLWVREALQADRMVNLLTGERTTNAVVAYYRADDAEALDPAGFNLSWVWERGAIPAIHMPRSFSRLTLVVAEVRVERLRDISEADAIAEGIEFVTRTDSGDFYRNFQNPKCPLMAYGAYRSLWDSLNAKRGYGWDANPWVAAITFETIRKNIDAIEKETER